MCRRYSIFHSGDDIRERFKVNIDSNTIHPRYNAAPSQVLPVISNSDSKSLSFFHWGIIPNWSKNKSISTKLINAPVEDIADKASYRFALKSRRCIVPADGYYEWKVSGKKTRIPYRIQMKDNSLFSMAGLWETFDDDEGNQYFTFKIVTTPSTGVVTPIHDRMPVILDEEAEAIWLGDDQGGDMHISVLNPYSKDNLVVHSVSPKINDLNYDQPDLLEPAPPADQFGNYTLFD